jgi:hypothetical protein
LEDLLS